VRDKNRSITVTFPKLMEFMGKVGEKVLFDNSKSEDFDVFPLRFWNLAERNKKSYGQFKTVNLGAEFFQYLMETYFEGGSGGDTLKNLDIRSILDRLKQME
jgi:hypothetical protein